MLAIAFAWLFVPETKGVQLEDVDLLFGPDVFILASKARKNNVEARDARAAMGDRVDQKSADMADAEIHDV